MDASGSVDENADGGTVTSVATENATSVTVDDDRFEVAGGNLKLKAGTSLDFEADTSPISVTITASGDGESATATVSVSINDVNEAPEITVADGAVDENADGATVGAVSATDADAGDSHTWSVSDDRFEVADGMLKLKDGQSLDHEAEGTVTVTVTVTDAAGLSASGDVTVTVNNVDEAPSTPVVRNADSLSVDENDDSGRNITPLDASTDPEGDAITYKVDDDRFEITAGNSLRLKSGTSLDHETDPTVTLNITAEDPAGNASAPATVTVTVNNVNEAPEITVADGAVDENAEGATVGAVSATDVDADDSHTWSVSDDRFEVADGMLKLKDGQSLDHETADSVTVTVTVTDAAGLSDSGDVMVAVNDVNEAPVITAADGDVDENVEGANVSAVSATDVDDGDMHTFSVSDDRFEVADGMLKLKDGVSLDHETDASVTVTVTVTDDGEGALSDSVDVVVTVDNVDEAPSAPQVRQGGLLTVNENASGALITSLENSTDPEGDAISYHVDDDRFEITAGLVLKLKSGASLDHESASSIDLMLTASDPAGNTSGATAITVGVGNVNEAPSVTAADGSVAENAAGATVGAVTVSDPDAGDTHSYSVSDDRFVVDGGMLKLKDGSSLDFETESSVTLTVTTTDAAGLSGTSAPVTVTVTDVNEDPSVDVSEDDSSSLTVPENDMGSDVMPLAAITLTDPDAADAAGLTGRDAQSNTAVTVGGEADDRFEVTLDSDGGLWLTLKDDVSLDHEAAVNGIIEVTVTFTDSADNTASASANVIVVDLNEAPSVTVADGTTSGGKTASSTVEENTPGALLGQITVSDPDDGDTYTLTAEPAPASGGEAPAAASSDGNGGSGNGDTGNGNGDSGGSGNGNGTAPAHNPFEVMKDDDGGYWLKLKDDASLDYEDGETVDVLVTATDADGLTGTATVTITVQNIEESPTAPTTRADTLSVDENDAGATVTVLDSTDPQGDDYTFQVWEKETGPNGDVNVAAKDFEIDNVQGTLKLKDGVALDHETVDSVVLYLTATDSLGHVSNETKITVAVNDLNEKPMADAMYAPKDYTEGEAGTALVIPPIFLEKLFSDEDDTDTVFTYKLKVSDVSSTLGFSKPLALNVVYTTYTATAPSVADAEYEYTPPADDSSDDDTASTTPSDGNGSSGDAATGTPLGTISVTDPDIGAAEGRSDSYNLSVSDDRFMIDDSLQLVLKAGETLSAETKVTVTATDSYGLSGHGTITVTIASDDDSADTGGTPAATSSDTAAPATKDVTFITGTVAGTPGAGKYGNATVAVVAVDDSGAESDASSTSFKLVVDDGNDTPTAINLFNNNGTSNSDYQLSVDENTAGVALGSLTADDIDSADHPNGQHKFTVNNAKFEVTDSNVLKLKKGESLDYETDGVVTVTVTATDKNGAKTGLSTTQDITITVNDKNDAPTAIKSIGSWWVTVLEDEDADDQDEGEWLSFGLETSGDNAAFKDQDLEANDSLTYSITGGTAASWLTIDAETGAIKNKAKTLATPGTYTVTVTATDEGEDGDAKTSADNKSASVSFKIYVAESDANDEDNSKPKIQVEPISGGDYTEGSGRKAVAKVHVTDEDFDLGSHPYAVLAGGKPTITAEAATAVDSQNNKLDYTSSFELSEKPTSSNNGNTLTWFVYAKKENALDHETEDDVIITVKAYNDLDNNGAYDAAEGDEETINVDVEDANEAPVFTYLGDDTDGSSSVRLAPDLGVNLTDTDKTNDEVTAEVQQEEDAVINLYLNLNHLWSDADSGDDVDELTFTVTEDSSWMKVLHHPAKWEDIKGGKDGKFGGNFAADDVAWESGRAVEDDDMVAIVQIDRVKYTDQAENGIITLTATDEGGKTGEGKITVNIDDEDLNIGEQAVKILGTPREGYTLMMRFDHTKDPDLASGDSPVVVVYMWQWTDANDEVQEVKSVGAPAPLKLTQEHVDKVITAKVAYYERGHETGRDIAGRDATAPYTDAQGTSQDGLTATTTKAVENVNDKATSNVVFWTEGTDLRAEIDVMDEDGIGDNATFKHIWQVSDNGVGGWTDLNDSNTADTKVELGATGGGGKYYRVVSEVTDLHGSDERVESPAIRVGKLADKDSPTVTGNPVVGGTLTVDTTGGGTLQWQKAVDGNDDGDLDDAVDYWTNIPGGASLKLNNSDHGGETLRAIVTHKDASGNVTAIHVVEDVDPTTADNQAQVAVAAAPGDRDPAKVKDIIIEANLNKPAKGLAAITEVKQTVDLDSMFNDPDGDKLTFSVPDQGVQGNANDSIDGGDYGYLDTKTGKLVFVTDNQGNHDGDTTDAGGNSFQFQVNASDGAGESASAYIIIRLNSPPTNVSTDNNDASDTTRTATMSETLSSTAESLSAVTLNVLDENLPTHDFGKYTWTVDDSRFKIAANSTDSSQATLTTKAKQSFARLGDAETAKGATVVVKVTATEKEDSANVVTFTVTISVSNDITTNDPTTTAEDKVPGLDDDESGTNQDDRYDDDIDGSDNQDDDDDGGVPPTPPPATMMIEEDLLDSFVLAIDDIDAA